MKRWRMHEFVDAVRNPALWAKTKKDALEAGNGVEIVVGNAKRQRARELLDRGDWC